MEGGVKDLASYRLSTAYVDFHQSLAVIYMAKLASKYFDGVTVADIELERA